MGMIGITTQAILNLILAEIGFVEDPMVRIDNTRLGSIKMQELVMVWKLSVISFNSTF